MPADVVGGKTESHEGAKVDVKDAAEQDGMTAGAADDGETVATNAGA